MIEVLVTLVLVSFGILGMVGLQIKAVGLSADADDRNRAALLANDLVSQMWLTDPDTVQAQQLASEESNWYKRARDPAQGGLPGVQAAVTAVPAEPKSWDVTITWTPPQRSAADLNAHKLTTRVTLP
jgi:type IV pilus assembly protein PilV